MKRAICGQGETAPGSATTTFTRGETTIVIKHAPAHISENCGEEYFDEDVTRRLLSVVDEAGRSGVEVDMRTLVAA